MHDPLEAFRKSKLLQGSYTTAELNENLSRLRLLDKEKEALQRHWKRLGCGGCLAAFGSFFMLLFFPLLALPLLLCGVPLGLLGAFKYWRHGKLNLADERYESLARILRLLATDCARDAAFAVRLDLNSPEDKRKLTHTGEIRGWKTCFYHDPFLDLAGRFLDGTRFRLHVIERFQVRTRWKRNARGKSKHKRKTKSACEAHLLLDVKGTRYGDLTRFADQATQAIQVPLQAKVKRFNLEATRLELRVSSRQPLQASAPNQPAGPAQNATPHLVALLFLSGYQILNLAQRTAKEAS